MATTEVNTAETVPLTPLQKIEVDDKELITAEYDDSAKQFSKDELQKVKIEITKALETKQLGDEEADTTQVQNDAVDVRAQENVKDSEGRVFEQLTSDPEVAEEITSSESHVHSGNEDKGELHINEKLEKLEESSTVGKQVDKVEEIDEPCVKNVDKEEVEEPAGSQSDKEVPGAAGQTQDENIESLDHHLEQKSHKEGETQGANESSHEGVKDASSIPFKQIEEDAENGIPEKQAEISKEPESVPNVLHTENLEVAQGSKELQGAKEESILIDPYKSKIDDNNSERDISVEVIAGDLKNKESTSDISNQHEKGVENVPEQTQTGERLFVQTKELETEEKVADSAEVEENVLRSIDKLEDEPQLARSLKDDAEVENLESFPATIPEKIKEAEPSDIADKKIPDAEEHLINEQQTGEKDANFTELTPTNETDTIQLDLDETENADVPKPIEEGSGSLTEETQSAEIEKIDDDEASRPKTEEEKERVPLTEITETEGSPNAEAATGNIQSVELEIPQEIDTERVAVMKDAESEKADVVQVTEELQEDEEVQTVAATKEVDIPPVISLTCEVNEQNFEEKSKDDPTPTQHTEQLLQVEENKSEKREAIIEKVIDEPISTSINDSKTEQTNFVEHDENLLTESHGEDVTYVSLHDENEDSNKKEVSEQLITEVSKVEEEPEKIASRNYKAEVELPESSLNSSTEEPEVIVTSDKDSTSIATTEELTDKIDGQGNHASEYKTSDIESAREMNFQLTKTNENTGEAEAEILEDNADVKEMLSTDQIPAETKGEVSDDSGLLILPGEGKDDISATSKTVDGTPEEIKDMETSDVRSDKAAELVEALNIDTSQISKDGDAETKDGEKTELAETAVDSSSELPLAIESHQKKPLKDEEEDEKPSQLDETPSIAELVPVVTLAEIEDALGKDEGISTSLSEQAPVEKDGHIETDKEDPTSECNIQGIAEEHPVESRGETGVDYSEVPKEVTKNAKDKSSDNIVEESVVGDVTEPDELTVPVIGIQAHGIEEVFTQAEQIEDAASLDRVENKVQTSLEVVSEPDHNDSGYHEKITEPDSDDSEKPKQVSEQEPGDLDNLNWTCEPDAADSEKLKQVSEPDRDDSEYLKQTSDDSKILEHVSEPNPDDTEVLEEVLKPDSDHSEKFNQVSEPAHDDPEILEQASKKELDHSENLMKVSEQDPDDSKTLKFSEPDPDNTEKRGNVEKTNIPADCDQITIKAEPDSTNVDVFEKTDKEPREPTVSDEVNTVSVAEEPVTQSFEVNTATDTAPEESIEEPVNEEEYSHQIPELRTEEKTAPSQTTQEQTEEKEIEHVEESGSVETVSTIQHNDDTEEKKTSEVLDECIINEVQGAEGLSPPADAFVVDRKPDEADKDIEEEIKNVVAAAKKDESDIPVTVVEGDQTLILAVEEQQNEDEFHKDEPSKEVILQENDSGQEPEHSQKEAEETEPSTLSLNDEGNPDFVSKEAPEKVLQEEKEKEGIEEADNFAENINVSEVLVQPHYNPGEETEQTPRTEDTKLAVSTEEDGKITSLNSEEEKEETQEVFIPEIVKEKENDEPKNDDNVEQIKTADEVVVQDEECQPDKLLNEPKEVQEGLSVENEPEANDKDTEISVEATAQQTEKEEIVHLSKDAEVSEIPSDNFTALKAEDINEAENEKDNDQANIIDTVHEIETATDINKEEKMENVATDTNKVESEIPITVIEADHFLVQEVKEHHQEDEILKDEESKEEKEPGEEPEHLPKPSASSSNDDGITHLVSKALLPKEVLQEETEKDEVEDTGNIIEKTRVSEVLAQPHDKLCEEAENLSSETVVTEMAPSVVNDEKITSLKSHEGEETQKEVEPEIIIEDRKENNQKPDEIVEQKQTVDDVVVPEDEQAKPDQMLNEPLGNEPSATGLNDEDTVQREKGPEEVQEKLSVESQPEADDKVREKKVAEEAIVQQDKQREIVNLPNEAEHNEIPHDNFAELNAEEKENEKEEEKDQDQAKKSNTVHEKETATEAIIQEDQQVEQLQQSEDKEAELSTKGVNEKELIIPKNNADEIETTKEKVAQESQAVKLECLLGDTIASEATGDDGGTTVLRTDEDTEEILQDEKKAGEVNVDTEAKENANEEVKNEDEQCQFEHVSNETAKPDPPVLYTSGEKQTNLEKDEAIKEIEEKSKNEEKEIVSRELVFQEPSALLGNDDDIITLKNEETTEVVQEQKETKLVEVDGYTNKIVEAESFVEKSLVDENVVRGEEGPEQVEDGEQGKDQEIDENLTATKLSVENEVTVKEEKKGDELELELELEHYPKLIEDAELHASSSGDEKNCVQEIGDEVKVKDLSNEDSNLTLKELDAAASKENDLDSKKPASIEDNAKEHSTIEDGSSSSILENKVETSNLETEHTKTVEEATTAGESNIEEDIDEVITESDALPTAEDKSNNEDGNKKGLTETEARDVLESLPSVEVSDSDVQRDFVGTAKETEEEKLESTIPVAAEEDKKDLISTETQGEKSQGSKGNVVSFLGEETHDNFVITNTAEKDLHTLGDNQGDVTLKEALNEASSEYPGNQEEALGEVDQKKQTSSELLNDETTTEIKEQETYVEAGTSVGSNTVEPEEIPKLVLDKGNVIQREPEGDGYLPTIAEKSSLGHEAVTRATLEAPVTEKVPDISAIEIENTLENITKDEIIIRENSVNEEKNLEPLSIESSKVEELSAAKQVDTKEALLMQETSLVTTQLEEELDKHECQEKSMEVTQKAVPEEENKSEQQYDLPSEMLTEHAKLREPEAVIALVEEERAKEITTIELDKEETKGNSETQFETPNISEDIASNEVLLQKTAPVSLPSNKSEIDQFTKSEISNKIAEETIVSVEAPQVSSSDIYAAEKKQINEAQVEELLEKKMEPIKKNEAVKFDREITDKAIQDLNTGEIKGKNLEELDLDKSNTNDADNKVNITDKDAKQVIETPNAQVALMSIPLEKLNASILERQVSEEPTEKSMPGDLKSTEGVKEGTTCEDLIAIAEKKDDIKPSSVTEIQSTSRELASPENKMATVQTEGSDTNLGIQQLKQSTKEVPLKGNTHTDKNPKDGPTPVSKEKDFPTEVQQSTARSLEFTEVAQPENFKKTESNTPLNITEESSLSDLLQISPKDTIQMSQQPNQETNSAPKKENLQTEDPKTDEDKDNEADDEEGDEHKKTDSSSDGVIVEASRDMDVKSPQKKHHGILSGVGIKVKNSISKVKKAITGKSSHPKPPSPK